MIATVLTMAVLACMFGATHEITQQAGIEPVEQQESNSVTFVGFDGYVECDAVKQILEQDSHDGLQFIVVQSAVTQDALLSSFLTRMRALCPSSRVPFNKVREHWAKIFSAPVHIFVFCNQDHAREEMKEVFSYSNLCFEIVAKSLELSRGFFWMGTMSVIEEQVKDLLDIPKGSHLVATIFFGDQKDQIKKEVSAN